ncbi:unnamed protein product [Caenorhabditis angaria]|uniref:Aftiphilin clathrin-binding box domain-containing protein n=1 Tax=Caenorhabditis angaria TaxID=860376 RepID=A0A9P1N819_9PELO|nr:unnamed protein product [Caenorhabditis angaria]
MEIDEGPPPFNGVVEEDVDDVDTAISFGNLDHSHIADTSTMKSFSMLSIGQGDSMVIDENISEFPSSPDVVTGKEEENDEDEWGDFGEASTTNPPVEDQKNEEEEDDEWGDFDQARPSRQQSVDVVEPSPSKPGNLDSFDDDDWQAEFTGAPEVIQNFPSSLKGLEEMLEDREFWNDGFDENNEIDLRENLEQEEIENDLWKSLRVVEEAFSLKFEWKNSSTRGKHFRSIKIDEKQVRIPAKSAFDMSSILLPTQPSTSTTQQSTSENSKKEVAVESPSIPVVDFDWDTSGLTNPLKGASQSSAIIDVDFLHSNGASSYTNPLQKDLADFGLNSVSETISGTQSNSSSSNILDSIMTKVEAGRKSPYRDTQVLSLDARSLLDQLPDLQYIQSNMLMFPMGSGTTQHFS